MSGDEVAGSAPSGAEVLRIENLKTWFFTEDGVTRAVDGIDLTLHAGETLGVVGESGCGKSVTALSVLGLLPERLARIVDGSVHFEGRDLTKLSEAELRRVRGRDIAMIFQEPMTSLNPVFTIGHQIAEAVKIHKGANEAAARARAADMLRLVRIPDAERRLDDYPHQFSGGMRQRAMIAMALACDPKVLIADEPTTALDVTIQAQILELMLELKERTAAAVMLITHDLGVVAETCKRVAVVYAGRKVEEAPVEELFDAPAHPYTRGLMASIPRMNRGGRRSRLAEIPGIVPNLREAITGCAFAPRCPLAGRRCLSEAPQLRVVGKGHIVACHEAERALAS
jgi:peptide/nickel transport system ATP-binding protein